ncbi:MAG: DUF3429 domain-containing protein [Rhodospirillales bacterium]|nr:DUF3429 domain-containing protein [Rhodospirillales bacterium]
MNTRLPAATIVLGAAGVLPFLALALAALSRTGASAEHLTTWLVAYGAVVLSFLGAVHWGFVLGAEQPPRAWLRMGFGVLPALAGWAALWLDIAAVPAGAIALLIAAYLAVAVVERSFYIRGWLPRGYLWLRYMLTLAVVLILATVLTLRLLGAHILL